MDGVINHLREKTKTIPKSLHKMEQLETIEVEGINFFYNKNCPIMDIMVKKTSIRVGDVFFSNGTKELNYANNQCLDIFW